MAWCRGEASSPTTSFCFSGHLSFVHFLKKGISIIIQSNLKHTHACIKCIWMREMIRYIYQIFVWPECLKNKQRKSAKLREDNDHITFSLTIYLAYFLLMLKETYSLITCWNPWPGDCGRVVRRRDWDANTFQVRSTCCAKLNHNYPGHLHGYESML